MGVGMRRQAKSPGSVHCRGLLCEPEHGVCWGSVEEFGGDLLSHGRTTLSSALSRFTVLFGMGRGGTKTLWPPNEEGSVVRLGCCPVRKKVVGQIARFVFVMPAIIGSSRTVN